VLERRDAALRGDVVPAARERAADRVARPEEDDGERGGDEGDGLGHGEASEGEQRDGERGARGGAGGGVRQRAHERGGNGRGRRPAHHVLDRGEDGERAGRGQRFAQRGERARHARLHGRARLRQRRRDVGLREARVVRQHDGGPLLRRQAADVLGDDLLRLAAFHGGLLPPGGRPRGRARLERAAARPLAAQAVEHDPRRHRVDPRRLVAPLVEEVEALERAQERLLRRVLGLRGVAQHAKRQVEDRRLTPEDQELEAGGVGTRHVELSGGACPPLFHTPLLARLPAPESVCDEDGRH
jgi:hypothetical protein